jgi:hypothetical protein
MKKEYMWWLKGENLGEESWNEEVDYNTDEYHYNQDKPHINQEILSTTFDGCGTGGTTGSSGSFGADVFHSRFMGFNVWW